MKAIIEVDVPDYQIGQEVSIYFKDTMMIKGKVQEPKTGHWIKDDITERSKSAYKHKCDRCGAYHRAMYDYCPSCDARMVEPQESEGEE